MENASKALIISGEILIAVLVLSLASYVITQFGSFSKTLNTKMEESQITGFNVRFTNFSGRANISAQEISSLVNLANQRNAEYNANSGDDFYVDVLLDGNSILNTNINEFLETNKNNTYYYCNLKSLRIIKKDEELQLAATTTEEDIDYNEHTQLVNKINFHTIKGNNKEEYVNALLEGNKIVWDIK